MANPLGLPRPVCWPLLLLMTLPAACTHVPEPVRPALAAPRLVNGFGVEQGSRWRLDPALAVEVVMDEQLDADLQQAVLSGLRREFPNSVPGGLAGVPNAGVRVRIFVVVDGDRPVPASPVAGLPGQFGIGPSGDVVLRFTWVDAGSGQLIEQAPIQLRRRWLLAGHPYATAIEQLVARHAQGLKLR